MEHNKRPLETVSEQIPRAQEGSSGFAEDDPELERELQEIAQWLLDVYLWRLHEEQKARGKGEVDNHPPPATI